MEPRAAPMHLDRTLPHDLHALLAAMLDALPDAIFLCDRDRRIVYGNAGARAVVARVRGAIAVEAGRIDIVGWPDGGLSGGIASAMGERASCRNSAALCHSIVCGTDSYAIRLEALPDHPFVMIFVRDMVRAAAARAARARAQYRLTAAEGRLAASLLAGKTLEHHAAACGIRTSTARSQMAALLAKTDTRRQAELVARLCAGPVPPDAGGVQIIPRACI